MTDLLGLPLQEALRYLEARGEEARIIYTRDPRQRTDSGTWRVLRVKDGTLTVGCFQDADPAD